MPGGPRLAADVAILPTTQVDFIGSSQFLHLVSMRAVLDCGVVRPPGGYRISGPAAWGAGFLL